MQFDLKADVVAVKTPLCRQFAANAGALSGLKCSKCTEFKLQAFQGLGLCKLAVNLKALSCVPLMLRAILP